MHPADLAAVVERLVELCELGVDVWCSFGLQRLDVAIREEAAVPSRAEGRSGPLTERKRNHGLHLFAGKQSSEQACIAPDWHPEGCPCELCQGGEAAD